MGFQQNIRPMWITPACAGRLALNFWWLAECLPLFVDNFFPASFWRISPKNNDNIFLRFAHMFFSFCLLARLVFACLACCVMRIFRASSRWYIQSCLSSQVLFPLISCICSVVHNLFTHAFVVVFRCGRASAYSLRRFL